MMKHLWEYKEMSFSAVSIAMNSAGKNREREMLEDNSSEQNF